MTSAILRTYCSDGEISARAGPAIVAGYASVKSVPIIDSTAAMDSARHVFRPGASRVCSAGGKILEVRELGNSSSLTAAFW